MKRFFIFLFCLFSLPSFAANFSQIKKHEPNFSQIQQAFFDHEELSLTELNREQKRARRSALLPILSLGYDHQLKRAESLSITDNISVTSAGVTVGPEDNDIDYGSNWGQMIRVRAVWRLDRLLTNSESLAVLKHKASVVKLRFQYSKELFALYEKRYALLWQYLQSRRSAPLKAKQFYAKYEWLTDELDALTGRRFQNRFWREK